MCGRLVTHAERAVDAAATVENASRFPQASTGPLDLYRKKQRGKIYGQMSLSDEDGQQVVEVEILARKNSRPIESGSYILAQLCALQLAR